MGIRVHKSNSSEDEICLWEMISKNFHERNTASTTHEDRLAAVEYFLMRQVEAFFNVLW